MDRRTFLYGTGLVGATFVGSKFLKQNTIVAQAQTGYKKPNILVIVVDQLRTPQWFPQQVQLDAYLPEMARLRKASANFTHYYTAATACSPARGTLLTGLYAHQTALLTTIVVPRSPVLNPGFPTWGGLLRGLGYSTWWFGKWHLSEEDSLEPYGFSGGTYPSPDGTAGQGYTVDPFIVSGGPPPAGIDPTKQFADWLNSSDSSAAPWCTTVSLINPHDIAWYPRGTSQIPAESNPPSVFKQKIPNFETPIQLAQQNKPRLQELFRQAENIAFGFVPPQFGPPWLKLLDTYLLCQQFVDRQIGIVLDLLEKSPYGDNTIIIFTSDHGEYGGSHGLRGKGGAAYEESINVPFYVKDPTRQWVKQPGTQRSQLCSSVDVAPLLLTLATGSNQWRSQATYAHLKNRLDLAQILKRPSSPGRSYVLHTTDEPLFSEFTLQPIPKDAPMHVIGYRTAAAKLGVYTNWLDGTLKISKVGLESELYNYKTETGAKELENVATAQPQLYRQLYNSLFQQAIPQELRRPLPSGALQAAQQQAKKDYLKYMTFIKTLLKKT